MTRRRFLAGTGATMVAFTMLQPELVRGSEANSKIDIGLIGCGGRGTWIAGLFQKHGGYNLAALADYFPDRVDHAGEKLQVPASKRFTTLSAYKRLLEEKLDAVMILSPPYFHPEHAAAAVDAGKHVYLAKPIGVDVPGCLSVQASGQKATEKRQCFLVDFQTRANKLYQEAVARVHAGELGKTILVEADYQCSLMFQDLDDAVRRDPGNRELRLRAWAIDRTLSGDVITEQNIHAIDVASWMINAQPMRAYGAGGRTRPFIGNCWDHFAVIFYYPEKTTVSFNSHQSGFGYDDILCRLYGLNGTVDTHYGGPVTVHTRDFRSQGSTGDLYTDGAVTNIATFHDVVTNGDCSNPTVPPSVRSNLTTILGRTAAYKNTVVTWDEMMDAKEKFVADLSGLKA